MDTKKSKSHNFVFITPEREAAIQHAAHAANNRRDQDLATSNHLLQQMSPLNRANLVRAWFIANVSSALDGTEGAQRRTDNNIDGIEFDNRYFVYFRNDKLESQIPPREAKTLWRARHEHNEEEVEPELQQLSYLSDDETKQKTPLGKLQHFIVTYVKDTEGRIISLRLELVDQDQDPPVRLDTYEVNLINIPVVSAIEPQNQTETPTTTFTFKKPQTKEETA